MAEHTQGPWTVGTLYPYGYDVVGADGSHVARVHPLGSPTAEANARLIAAAPEMLAFLESLPQYDHAPTCLCVSCQARPLIAKARGADGDGR